MDQQQKPIIKPPPVYKPIKFLLSSVNTSFGKSLVQRLRNDGQHPENPNRILGTVCNTEQNNGVYEGVRKIIDTGKIKFFEEIILNSDVLIYDLNTCDLKQAQFVISTLKLNSFKEQKTLICISNIMTWAKTKPKQKKQGDEEDADDNPPQQPDTQIQGQPQAEQGQQKKNYVRFQDKDYPLRKPDPQYQNIKSIQTLAMAAGKVKSNLSTFIVCSGLLYGQGQRVLAPYFMQARLQEPQSLAYYGNGKNRIPTVHIQDLITYVEKVIEKKPDIPYILALDHNPKPTQKSIISSISNGIGTGKIISKQFDNNDPNLKVLTVNIRMKPTMYFIKLEEEQAAIQQEEGNETPKFTFKWAYKDGIQKSIKKLCEQFNNFRGLTQTKIFIAGPPGSGKSFFSEKRLAKKYNLPHIHVKSVIQDVKNIQGQGLLGEEIRNYFAQKKQQISSQLQAKYDEDKQKQKKIPKQFRQPLQPFNPDKVQVRLTDQLINKCYKWRLNQNDCLNRGYILDGYPKKYQDAVQLFMGMPPLQQDQEPDQNTQKIIEIKLIPNILIILQISDQQIVQRLQNLPEQQLNGTHFSAQATKKRLKIYRKLMDGSTGQFSLQDFFKQSKVQINRANAVSQTMNMLQSIIKTMPLNQQQEQLQIKRKIGEQSENRRRARLQMDNKQKIMRDVQNEDYRMKKQNEQNQETQILDRSSRALRRYLDVNLVPILSEGLVEILNKFPSDPVDTLAEFLFQNSLKVPNPDPSTFQF